ncbi:tRNA pseudouridine(65) synthase TruC [Cocleimonas flava]|uniref:tRNA pseudouridine synthase C n=1 Tax=Cocleimonas flava TaxID=634765 RepID=A0A4R1EZU8_9GAMM|nr:pseudouridine synthase [Cocleimonas flava]TCJ87437.1 tRNA pseudouridine synthase C [Cocleimonas flava]
MTDFSDSFSIIYQDDDIVAIHKPAGLLVHRSWMDSDETQFAVQMTRDAIGQKVFPVHRLDKPTSGVLIFALSSEVARLLQEQFQNNSIEKEYLALVRGWPSHAKDHGKWIVDKPLKYHVDKFSEPDTEEGKMQEAETHFDCLQTATIQQPVGRYDSARYALVKAMPKTGRKHQIRRHLNHCNHPIVGDVNHGDRHHNHFFQDHFKQTRLYLAATQITLTHPISLESLVIEAPIEASFQSVIDQIDWD